jgi:hypothetical protein
MFATINNKNDNYSNENNNNLKINDNYVIDFSKVRASSVMSNYE